MFQMGLYISLKGQKIEHLLNGKLFKNQHRPQLSFKSSDLLHISPLRKVFFKMFISILRDSGLWSVGSIRFLSLTGACWLLQEEPESCSPGLCFSRASPGTGTAPLASAATRVNVRVGTVLTQADTMRPQALITPHWSPASRPEEQHKKGCGVLTPNGSCQASL